MPVVCAKLRIAATDVAGIPVAIRPEIAVAGRSNVGKSSLINRLTGRKRLARTSTTPGCTRGLLFFDIDDRLTLVDLPGYGWARRSRRERSGWRGLVEGYLRGRSMLAGTMILVDVRRGPEDEERQLANFLESEGTPFLWVVTKCDKFAKSRLHDRARELDRTFGGSPLVLTSARTGLGKGELWHWIDAAVGGGAIGVVPRA